MYCDDELHSSGIHTDVSSGPITEHPEPDTTQSNQGASGTSNGPQPPNDMEFRIKELQNRHFLLMEMQRFMKKTERHRSTGASESSPGASESLPGALEDSGQLCELEAVQKELDELLVSRELEKHRLKSGQQAPSPALYKTETPRGGVYTLPPPQPTPGEVTLEDRGKVRTVADVVPVGLLSQTAAVTKCPSCDEVVLTETRSKVGEGKWLVCFLCVLSGCVAGCCLIPFCMSRLSTIQHQCPKCHAEIHTHTPF
uniref:LITAF domain-containing protein n=1 Tax=Gasterosteus aculeatus aculeatus TaxID=481459 RepID=A0AAQ4RG84_GASAC